ncbi:HAD family hydrolase [Actinoplanes friuliensis]|uniref:Haloacid dehalogenase domain-containing protein hydrolase n=1 Tax=Actinoplanes friuliensis DSM 7358 TaxID=1246995 RepID=U5W8N1_9ACTN|nr:HAD family hydrolase [Actinoplanes friuliensis]AGZ44296.1 haloacid dehalogenase domain-containing protein hydrolase [Actinoplanes friuliensis DSM 7358]
MPPPPLTCVLFDFAWTLFAGDPDTWVRGAAQAIGRPVADGEPAAISAAYMDRLRTTATDPAHLARDLDPSVYDAAISVVLTGIPGVTPDFAAALAATHMTSLAPYADVASTFKTLKTLGVRIGVVSNIGCDLRPAFTRNGLDGFVDAFVLSYEVGFVKPDPAIWKAALHALRADPAETVMVGDHPAGDGGAVVAGIAALVLPQVASPLEPRGLDHVVALVHGRARKS